MTKFSETASQFYNKVASAASYYARAAGEQLSKAGASVRALAAKVSRAVYPYWDSFKRAISENRRPLLIAVGGIAIISALALLAADRSVKNDPKYRPSPE